MRERLRNTSWGLLLRKIDFYFFIVLFSSISLLPAPVHERLRWPVNAGFIVLLAILLLAKRKAVFKFSDYPLWILLTAVSVNVLFAQHKDMALKTYLDLAISMFCIYYWMSRGFSDDKKFDFMAKTICVCSVLVSLGGLLEFIFAYNPIYEHWVKNPFYKRYITGFVRPMSTQLNPAVLGSYLLASLPFNYLLFRQDKSFFRWLGAGGVLLNAGIMILTFSRGAFLGLAASGLFYLLMRKKGRSLGVFSVVLILFILLVSHLPYPANRYGKNYLIENSTGTLSVYRLTRCRMAWRMICEYPLTGLGFQHFRIRFYEFWPYKYKVPYETRIPDNMYLALLSETGIVGMLGFLIFIGALLRRGFKKIREADKEEKQRFLISLSALVGLLVNMGGYDLFYWRNPYMFFCLLCGLVAVTASKEEV
jgi:O-antigen ligase